MISEAINNNLRVFINNFESFKYIYDENIICKDEDEMFQKNINNSYINNSKIYKIEKIVQNILKLIKN